MADDSGNDSPLVKLVEAMLDDNEGISDKAYGALGVFLKQHYGARLFPGRLQKMLDATKETDGRVYISEDWDESTSGR